MNQERTKRKLTAILSADAVGYSRLMEEDQAWTIKNLEENKTLISDLVEEYKGRVVDAPGDNILAEFNSVINSVECAVKIQQELKSKNDNLVEARRMHFRIGVNLGDVVEEDGRIYGNGVNIAARLEGLAEPGGICISRTAYDQVKSKIEVDYDYLGEYQVKNINEPVRVYHILMGGESTEKYVPHGKSNKIINPFTILSAVIILLVVALGTTIAILYPKPQEVRQVVRFEYELPDGQEFHDLGLNYGLCLAISPDGSQIAFSTSENLYIRTLNELESKRIPGTKGNIFQPFFSYDGKWLGYGVVQGMQFNKIPIEGGAPEAMCFAPFFYGAVWNSDNTIVYADAGSIKKIPANEGNPETLLDIKEPGYPQILSNGKILLFTDTVSQPPTIVIYNLKSKEQKRLFAGYKARYLSTGHLVYLLENSLYAVPFNLNELKTTGTPALLIDDICDFVISESGTLAYIPGPPDVSSFKSNLVWVDRSGKETLLLEQEDYYGTVRISPDGTKVAYTIDPPGFDSKIWVYDIARKNASPFNLDKNLKNLGPWTHDSRKIFYSSTSRIESGTGIYLKAASGIGEADGIFMSNDKFLNPSCLSKDGKALVIETFNSDLKKRDIELITIEDETEKKPLLHEEYEEFFVQISPDSQWMAFVSNQEGQNEVYVCPFPDVNKDRWKVSTKGGTQPLWSPGGDELYYRNGEEILAVSVQTKEQFSFKSPVKIFSGKYLLDNFTLNWDIHPKNKNFLMLKIPDTTIEKSDQESPHKIVVVTNWFEELKEKVPTN